MSLLNKVALIVVVLALALLAGLQTYTVVHFAQEPYIITSAKVTNSPLQHGDDVIIAYTADRMALCRTEADIFVLQVPEELLVQAARRPAGVTPLGTASWKAHISTMGMTPGKFVARIFVHSDCGDRLHTIMVPDMPFEVVE